MKSHSLEFTPFSQLPLEERRHARALLSQKIITLEGRSSDVKFLSMHPTEPGRPVELDDWVQVYFTTDDDRTIYNMYIFSASKHFWEAVSKKAQAKFDHLLPKHDFNMEDFVDVFEKYRQAMDKAHSDHGGMTPRQLIEIEEALIIETSPPAIYESFDVDFNFEYGIGVYSTVDAPYITDKVIESTINKFLDCGEKAWRAAEPIKRVALPSTTHTKFLERFSDYLSK